MRDPSLNSRLPNHDGAVIDRRKVAGYLLSHAHSLGRSKATFFEQLGFQQNKPEPLEAELKRIARDMDVVETEDTGFGTRYVVEGELIGPKGAAAIITLWIIDRGSELPRLVSAYPVGGTI